MPFLLANPLKKNATNYTRRKPMSPNSICLSLAQKTQVKRNTQSVTLTKESVTLTNNPPLPGNHPGPLHQRKWSAVKITKPFLKPIPLIPHLPVSPDSPQITPLCLAYSCKEGLHQSRSTISPLPSRCIQDKASRFPPHSKV